MKGMFVFSLNVYPHPTQVGKAFADFVRQVMNVLSKRLYVLYLNCNCFHTKNLKMYVYKNILFQTKLIF